MSEAEDLHRRGAEACMQQRFEEAVELLQRACALQPEHADCYSNLAYALGALGRYQEAFDHCEHALRIVPGHAGALRNRASVLGRVANENGKVHATNKRFTDAIHAFSEAIHHLPEVPEPWMNRGAVRAQCGDIDGCRADYERAVAVAPERRETHAGLGMALLQLGRIEDAKAVFRRLLELVPGDTEGAWGMSYALLQQGDLADGFRLYESRWGVGGVGEQHRKTFDAPLWLGQVPLEGRTILLHAEQGLGDTIQFCRYAQLCAAQGAKVVLQVQPALLRLLRASLESEGIRCVGPDEPLPPFDLHCPLLSLPLACGTTLATVPSQVPYLRVLAPWQDKWRSLLPPASGPRVGIAWSGAAKHQQDRHRSIPLGTLLTALPKGPQYVSLQKDLRAGDAALLSLRHDVVDLSARIGDFADTAALCSLLDAVVTVDTSVAHLAGALGRPAFVLLAAFHDWRWIEGREDSPWYPTVRLLRQATLGDWREPLRRLGEHLQP